MGVTPTVPEALGDVGDIFPVRCYHAAVAADRHVLDGVETEAAGFAHASRSPAFIGRSVCLARVFQNDKVFARFFHCQNSVHVARIAVEVHRHEHFGFVADAVIQLIGINIARSVIDVSEYGHSGCVDNRVRGRNE